MRPCWRRWTPGQIGHATLDVFRVEPLPPDHPFWAHPRVTVTPHIAADTRPATAARVIAENIRRGEAGEPFLHLVDRSARLLTAKGRERQQSLVRQRHSQPCACSDFC